MTTEDIRIRCPSTGLCRFGRSFNVTTTTTPNLGKLPLEISSTLTLMRRQSVFRNSLLNPYNDHCSVLSKTAFVQIGPRISMQVQRVMERYTQDATRKHTTYTLSRRKTRTDTHHSRALDSPLELAYTHTAVFDENPCCIG